MFWGVTLESGKRYSQVVESSYHLSMAALEPKGFKVSLSPEGLKPNKYVSVMIEHGKTEFMLCTLEYDRVMQVALDLLFVEGEEVSFFLNGEGTVHLTGYVTDNEDKSLVLTDQSDEESEISDAEDTSYGKLLSMDVESDITDEEWIPKKVSKEKKKLLKTSPTSKLKTAEALAKQNAAAESTNKSKPAELRSPILHINLERDDPSSIKEEEGDISSEELDEDMDDVEEESDEDEEISDESEDDEEEESDNGETEEVPSPSKKKKCVDNDRGYKPDKHSIQTEQKKGSKEALSHKDMSKLSESTQKVPSNESIGNRKLEISKEKLDETPFRRKLEIDLQKRQVEMPTSKKDDNTPKTTSEDSATSQSKKKKKKRFSSENTSFSEEKSFTDTPKQPLSEDLVSGTPQDTPKKSVDTPATKKKTEIVGDKTKPRTPFRNKPENTNTQKAEIEITHSSKNSNNIPETTNGSATLSTGKKKKKKRPHSEDKSSAEDKSFTEAPLKDTPSTKLPGGVKVTDMKQGNGPQAKKGRFVHICYVGRLSNGEEFDSARDRPFSFRLGQEEVIKGLDTGIEGMKVGGKRKLVVPPNQGYGNKRVGPIPPNSTLLFEVELKAVS